jgi:ectoine hydroxylase-related dioxygenase (phytanoyl-CoA dioxygenase family)
VNTVRTELTTDELCFYRENGYLAIPDLLDADDLVRWREAVDEAVEARGDAIFAGRTALGEALERSEPTEEEKEEHAYYAKVFTQRVNLWQSSDRVRPLVLDSQLAKLAADLAGVDGIRLWSDQALIKPPYATFTAYHLDLPYWSFTSPDSITVWVALDDATLENGCMYYVPGTHKAGRCDNVSISKDIGALFEIYPEWRELEPVACPVPAGGACFHNGLTAHGAGANMTHAQRRAMTCAYMPDGSTFNGTPNVLPPSYCDTLEFGDVLDDDAHNPLVFTRGRPLATTS